MRRSVILLFLSCTACVFAQPSFLYPTSIPVGAPVVSIIGGDFNNDGIGDFAVSYGTSGLAVFLGRPDGTFARKDILNGSGMGGDNFLAAADVNGDHKLDLVGYGPVIMFGNGDGTFQDPFIPVVPRDPANGQSGVIGVADFDGDGIPDFLVVVPTASVATELGNGNGTFKTPGPSGGVLQYGSRLGVIAGLSHGGMPDAVFTQQFSAAPIVFHNQGDGSFRYLGTVIAGDLGGGPVQTLAAGDVNGDGNTDLVETSPQGVWVILGSGGTGFALLTNNYVSRQPQASYPSPAFVPPAYAVPEVALSDLDGDRKLDLASCYFVYPGKGDGTFGGPIYFGQMYDTMRIRPVIVEDVNGDGKPDIIGIGPDGQSVSVLINSSGAPVASAPAYLAGTGDAVVAPGALATIFGSGLSATTASFTSDPLPTTVGSTSVEIVDLAGTTFLAPLLYVSPTQINFQVPEGAVEGLAIINVNGTGRPKGANSTYVQPVATALFTLDGTGEGAPASSAVRVDVDGSQTQIPTISCTADGKCAGLPIPVGSTGQVYLSLYGTGFRHATSGQCMVGNAVVTPTYFGQQSTGSLIDQVNIPIPTSTPKGAVSIRCQFGAGATHDFGNGNTVAITVE